MRVAYSLSGRPFRVDGDHVWTREGRYAGKQVDGLFYNSSGVYIGEYQGDRLGYHTHNSGRYKVGHVPRMNKMAISRMDKIPQSMPSGWEDFHA